MTTIDLKNNRSGRRDKVVIMTNIIGLSKNGALKTQIMSKANLSYDQLIQYLKLLSDIDFLRITKSGRKEIYTATPKGLEFMEKQIQLIEQISRAQNNHRNSYKYTQLDCDAISILASKGQKLEK